MVLCSMLPINLLVLNVVGSALESCHAVATWASGEVDGVVAQLPLLTFDSSKEGAAQHACALQGFVLCTSMIQAGRLPSCWHIFVQNASKAANCQHRGEGGGFRCVFAPAS
jgi:hypothetical protein